MHTRTHPARTLFVEPMDKRKGSPKVKKQDRLLFSLALYFTQVYEHYEIQYVQLLRIIWRIREDDKNVDGNMELAFRSLVLLVNSG